MGLVEPTANTFCQRGACAHVTGLIKNQKAFDKLLIIGGKILTFIIHNLRSKVS